MAAFIGAGVLDTQIDIVVLTPQLAREIFATEQRPLPAWRRS